MTLILTMQQKEVTPLMSIENDLTTKYGVKIYIKRDDLIDPEISGNKYRKLKYNLLEAKKAGFDSILTFGGAFSNHIAATAAAAKQFGFKSIGIIRGDELDENSNPTLRKAADDGMNLVFVNRNQYRERENSEWLKELESQHKAFVVPEGGSNLLALIGMVEMVEEITKPFDYIICPVGTGGTLAGIVSAINPDQKAIGIAALKGKDYLNQMIENLTTNKSNWQINDDYHFGGYAKTDERLITFINQFYENYKIPLDPIYTGKMMFGIFDLVSKNYFKRGSTIVAIHTGGLQGIDGFNEKSKYKITFEK